MNKNDKEEAEWSATINTPSATKTVSSRNTKTEKFHLSSAQLFLTYPKCGVTKEEALQLLQEKAASKGVEMTSWIVAQELHKDDTEHLHVYLKLNRKLTIRDTTFWDLKSHHGNYQGCRSSAAVRKYCQKEGNFLMSPDLTTSGTSTLETFSKARKLARTDGLQSALEVLEQCPKGARDLTLYGRAIKASLKELEPISAHTATRPLSDFGVLFEWDRSKTLILCGPTNTGKTTLAVSLLPLSLLTRHLDRLAGYQGSGRMGIVLDDMSLRHLHDEAQIALLDTAFETQVHVRYHVAEIPQGVPRIITTNRCASQVVNMANPAIARRVSAFIWRGVNEWKPWTWGDIDW